MERRDVNALTVCFFGVFFFLSRMRERERENISCHSRTGTVLDSRVPCVHRCICILIGFSTSFKVTF